jgi:ribonuclease M5
MIKTDRVVIVEGKYDKIKLSSILDAVIIETDGFAIFNDKEKQKLIRRLAKTKGLLVLTDSDSAGFKIRSFIGGIVSNEEIKHAYIPDIFGKEKRKVESSKEGKLGVEGIPKDILLEALRKAGVTAEKTPETKRRQVTKTDLYEDGLSGRDDSASKRKAFLKSLDLPELLSANKLLPIINTFLTYEEYKEAVLKSGNDNDKKE